MALFRFSERCAMKPMLDRFLERVVRTSGCWWWVGRRNELGYGHIETSGKEMRSNRMSWILATGRNPGNLHVLHVCDNPSCVRPGHIYLGTHQQNMRDVAERRRGGNAKKTHCKNGHAFSPENTKMAYARRWCIVCTRAAARRNAQRARDRKKMKEKCLQD